MSFVDVVVAFAIVIVVIAVIRAPGFAIVAPLVFFLLLLLLVNAPLVVRHR